MFDFNIFGQSKYFTEKDIQKNIIAEIKKAKKFELEESPSLNIIDYCDDEKNYILEKINSEGEISVKKDTDLGKHLVASFILFKKREITFSHFRIKRLGENRLFDFSGFRKINFLFKFEKPTNILNVMIEEIDNDMWHYINAVEFKPDRWYILSIPLEKMYFYKPHQLEKYGNGKKEWNRIRGYWIDFSKLNGLVKAEDVPIKNTVHLGKIFLTNK